MFQPCTWQYFFFTFFIHQFHLQYTSVTIEVTNLYRMQSGFQCLLHNNLYRRNVLHHYLPTIHRQALMCYRRPREGQMYRYHRQELPDSRSIPDRYFLSPLRGMDTDSTTYSPLTGAASISAQRLPRKSCHTAFKPGCKAAGQSPPPHKEPLHI